MAGLRRKFACLDFPKFRIKATLLFVVRSISWQFLELLHSTLRFILGHEHRFITFSVAVSHHADLAIVRRSQKLPQWTAAFRIG